MLGIIAVPERHARTSCLLGGLESINDGIDKAFNHKAPVPIISTYNGLHHSCRLLNLTIVRRSVEVASALVTMWIDGLPKVGAILIVTRLGAKA